MAKNGKAKTGELHIPPDLSGEFSIEALIGQLHILREKAKDGGQVFEMACTIGESASMALDLRRFVIGEACGIVFRAYGEANVNEFAKRVGIAESTARQYQNTVEFYSLETCIELMSGNVRYAHLRLAKSLHNREAALELLERVASEHLTVKQMALILWGVEAIGDEDKATPAEKFVKLFGMETARVKGIDLEHGTVTLEVGDYAQALLSRLERPVNITIKVAEHDLDDAEREPVGTFGDMLTHDKDGVVTTVINTPRKR